MRLERTTSKSHAQHHNPISPWEQSRRFLSRRETPCPVKLSDGKIASSILWSCTRLSPRTVALWGYLWEFLLPDWAIQIHLIKPDSGVIIQTYLHVIGFDIGYQWPVWDQSVSENKVLNGWAVRVKHIISNTWTAAIHLLQWIPADGFQACGFYAHWMSQLSLCWFGVLAAHFCVRFPILGFSRIQPGVTEIKLNIILQLYLRLHFPLQTQPEHESESLSQPPYMPFDTVCVILRHSWSLLVDLVEDKGLDGVMINRSDRHRERDSATTCLSSDFTSSDVISSSKSTVLSLPIWNKLPPPDSYRHHRHQQKYIYICICFWLCVAGSRLRF